MLRLLTGVAGTFAFEAISGVVASGNAATGGADARAWPGFSVDVR